jgi:ABC-type Mn2+/Zn2+ transport systems, permease components
LGFKFFTFFLVLLRRAFFFFSEGPLASDEIQLAVLSAVALSCGILSPFLVLKRMTMLANSLSHTILLGIALAALGARYFWGGQWFDIPTLLIGALVAALLTALCTETLTRWFRLQEDASIGLVFTVLFALGITLVTLYLRDVHLGIEAIMGNVDALQLSDVQLPALFIAINALVVFLFFKQFQLISFDSHLAKSFGLKVGYFRYIFLFLIAATCIGAFRAVGVILVLTFLTGPYLIARLFSCRLERLLIWTPLIGVGASFIGVALSRHLLNVHGWALSTGGLVSTVIGLLYIGAKIFVRLRKKYILRASKRIS